MAFDPNVFDVVTVTDWSDVYIWNETLYLSVYDAVIVTENVSGFSMRIYTDPRPTHSPKWPTWSLEAVTQTPMLLEETLQGRTFEGRFGAEMEEVFPLAGWSFEGSMSESPLVSIEGMRPTPTLAGWFGCRLEEKSPFWQVDLTMIGYDLIRLNKTIAGWTIDAAMLIEMDLTLSAKSPRWELVGSIGREDEASLDKSLPFWRIEADVLSGRLITLDGKIPPWEIEASVYSYGMTLDISRPAWVMSDSWTEPGEATDHSRFTGIILGE